MNRFLRAWLIVALVLTPAIAFAASGDVDLSYGQNGFVYSANADASYTLAIQPDNKVIAGGQCPVIGHSHFCLRRYLPNGALDTSFGGGNVYTPMSSGDSLLRRVVVLPDGKILAVGYTSVPTSTAGEFTYEFAIVRYYANGSLDSYFGSGGIVRNAIMGYHGAVAVDVAVQSDGKYVVVGGGTLPSMDLVAVRLNVDGSFDPTFGNAGIVTIDTPYGGVQCVTIQPDGKILLGGWEGVSPHILVARLTTAGTLDNTFNGNGLRTYEVGINLSLKRMFVRPDGKILALGSSQVDIGSGYYLEIARINANGTMDTTYDGDGVFFSNSSGGVPSRANDFLLQPNGRIVATGNLSLNGNSYSASARYSADDPQLDQQFGDKGKILRLTSFDTTSVVMQSDGKLVFGGTQMTGPGAYRFFLVRHLNNGTRDADFDNDRKSDVSVFRPATRTWYLSNSTAGFSAVPFGAAGDRIVPADYDGDGKIDVAVFRAGGWYLIRSSDNSFVHVAFGQNGDVPVPADYDGDSKTDVAVFRAGTWYILNSGDNTVRGEQFGLAGDQPVIGNFDGDLRSDLTVYRSGTWYVNGSAAGFSAVQFGIATDRPVAGDYDSDGKSDFAVYRDGDWYVLGSWSGFSATNFGLASDRPVPADYDGDGRTDLGVFRDGVWYTLGSQTGFRSTAFGSPGDVPVPAAYFL